MIAKHILSQTAMSPDLAPEIERLIFELAALSQPKEIPALMLVAWRVKEWVEPLLYRTLIFGPCGNPAILQILLEDFKLLISFKDPAFLARTVRNVFVPHDFSLENRELICATCLNVTSLYTTHGIPLTVSLPNLKRLHAPPAVLALHLPTCATTFRSLTHMHMFLDAGGALWDVGPTANNHWNAFGQLPSLTNLALHVHPGQSHCLELLACCTSLGLLLILEPDYLPPSGPRPTPPLTEDPRLVFFAFPIAYDGSGNWHRDAFAGFSDDLWARADRWVEKRRTGVVDIEEYMLPAELKCSA